MTVQETIRQTSQMNRQDFQKLFFYVMQTANTKYKEFNFFDDFMIEKKYLQKYDFEKQENKLLLIKQKDKQTRKLGLLKGKIKIMPDFDEPLDCFNNYTR